jgi:hypothetical protein
VIPPVEYPTIPPVAVYRWKSVESTKINCRVLLHIFIQRTWIIAAFTFTFTCTFAFTCTIAFLFTSFFSFSFLFFFFFYFYFSIPLSSGLLPAPFQIAVVVLTAVGFPCESFIAS